MDEKLISLVLALPELKLAEELWWQIAQRTMFQSENHQPGERERIVT